MAKRMAVFNTSPLTTNYGGVGPFMRNIDPFLRSRFELEYINMPAFIHDIEFIPRRLTYLFFILFNLFRFRKYDVLLSHVPEASFLLTFLNKPLVHIFHGNYNPMSQSRFWYGKYVSGIFRYFNSRILAKAALKYTVGNQREGVSKILNPINHQVNLRNEFEREGFVFAGRLEKIKNVDRIIEVYAQLPGEIRKVNKLYIAGEGSQESLLKKLADDKGMTESIVFAGSLANADLIRLVSERKILLMASSQEGMPMAIAEALSVGVPVVATDTGDIARYVLNSYNGYVVPVKFDYRSYVNCILNILGDYGNFSANALKSSGQFNAESIVNKLSDEIERII